LTPGQLVQGFCSGATDQQVWVGKAANSGQGFVLQQNKGLDISLGNVL